nr:MAG TPA: hypothetical protein [Microviridae sp.]
MECSPKRIIYHKTTVIDEDGVVVTKEDINQSIYKTVKTYTEKKTDNQGQTHVYTIRVVKKYGVQFKLF